MTSSVAIVGAGATRRSHPRAGSAADRLILGEPGGEITNRVRDVVAGLRSGGINAEISERIRHEVWSKLWGNMNMNPFKRPDALRNSQDAQLCRRA
jgi:ketopantoate reductase